LKYKTKGDEAISKYTSFDGVTVTDFSFEVEIKDAEKAVPQELKMQFNLQE
jgi:hypothetical protein